MAQTGVVLNRLGRDSGTLIGPLYTPADERTLAAGHWMATTGARARTGKRPGAGLEVSIGGSPEAWTLQPGVGVLEDTTGGMYEFAFGTAKTENMPTRPGAGTSRIDLLVIEVLDTDVYPGETTLRQGQVRLISGTAAASPAAPTQPHGTLLCASLAVPNSGSIVITQAIPRSVAPGGILPTASVTERTALDTAGLYKGTTIFREDLGVHQVNPTGVAEATTPGSWKNVEPLYVAYTPTVTGGGAGGVAARYAEVGKQVTVTFTITGAVTGTLNLPLPVPASANQPVSAPFGQGMAFRANAPLSGVATPYLFDVNNARFFASDLSTLGSGSYGTWTTSDTVRGSFTYERS